MNRYRVQIDANVEQVSGLARPDSRQQTITVEVEASSANAACEALSRVIADLLSDDNGGKQ